MKWLTKLKNKLFGVVITIEDTGFTASILQINGQNIAFCYDTAVFLKELIKSGKLKVSNKDIGMPDMIFHNSGIDKYTGHQEYKLGFASKALVHFNKLQDPLPICNMHLKRYFGYAPEILFLYLTS